MSHISTDDSCAETPRGPVVEYRSLDHPLRKAVYTALVASRLCAKPGYYISVVRFVERKCKYYNLHQDTCLHEFKRDISRVRLALLAGQQVPRKELGKILPRNLSTCRSFEKLLQYTRLGRALPYGTKRMEAIALKEQMERLCQPFDKPVPRSIQNQIDLIPAVGFGPMVCTDLVSASSCLEKTRKEGGRSALLRGEQVSPPLKPMSAMTRIARCDIVRDSEMEDVGHFDCAPLCILEQGAKTRIVTRHSAVAVANSHRGRRSLWPLLSDSKHITVSESITDPELGKLYFPKAPRNSWVYSADLSAATDHLGWPVIRSLCDRVGIPFSWVSPSTVGGVPVKRGTAMGLPCSWPVLSLVHYCVCRAVDPNHNFRIKGDDLIALWPMSYIMAYEQLCSSIGFVVNKTKSVRSRAYGVFCEVSYRRRGKLLLRMGDFPIKGFARGDPPPAMQWQMYERYGAPHKLLWKLYRLCCKRWFNIASKCNVEPYLPEQVGGLGFPPKKMSSQISKQGQSLVKALHNGVSIRLEFDETGPSTRLYIGALNRAKFSVHGNDKDTEFYQGKMYLIGRAAFIDCANSKFRKLRDSAGAKIRRLRDFKLKYLRVAPEPYPTDYATAYSVVSRLKCVSSDPLLWVGRSSEICSRDESLVSGVVRLG